MHDLTHHYGLISHACHSTSALGRYCEIKCECSSAKFSGSSVGFFFGAGKAKALLLEDGAEERT